MVKLDILPKTIEFNKIKALPPTIEIKKSDLKTGQKRTNKKGLIPSIVISPYCQWYAWRSRTSGLRIRSPLLYPAELQAQKMINWSNIIKTDYCL